MKGRKFFALVAKGEAHREGSRHFRRAAAKKASIPAMKKVIRRNNQRNNK